MSIQNTTKQEPHTDICGILNFQHKLVGGVNLSYSCIVALDHNTYVFLYPDDGGPPEKYVIPMGHAFIFACDLIHGGQDLPDHISNVRLHYLMKTIEFSNGGDVQGWLTYDLQQRKYVYKANGCADVNP